ncbi:MAG TPA: hypothetical protein VEO55_06685 [Candidatus Dormibacteraeota bacterium]|nr:hypothetical protein [Candidatus Dormibacteraeota bacterium]
MKVLSNSPRHGDRSQEFARSTSQPIGGVREFATFAVLILCLAVVVAVVFGHRRSAANRANSQPATSAHRAIVPNPRQSDAIVFGRGHNAVNGTKSQPATSAHRANAQNPSPRSDAPISSGQDYTAQDYTAWFSSTAGNLGSSAIKAQNVVLDAVVSLVWDPAMGLSNQVIGFVADSWVNPVTGDRIIFNAAPGASRMAVSILAFAMVGVLMLALAGPLYASWKTWRLSRAHGFRGRA